MWRCAKRPLTIGRNNMLDNFYGVIMAGGGGTRLWPLSNRERPKQMLTLGGERTLFQVAVDRLEGLLPATGSWSSQLPNKPGSFKNSARIFPADNYLIEPMPRGTASVVGLAASALYSRDPDATMAILTADHYIENVTGFKDVLRAAAGAAQDGYLVTSGHSTYDPLYRVWLHPTGPGTGCIQ
jgi:mannose-1-phosphate guanylyltransferase